MKKNYKILQILTIFVIFIVGCSTCEEFEYKAKLFDRLNYNQNKMDELGVIDYWVGDTRYTIQYDPLDPAKNGRPVIKRKSENYSLKEYRKKKIKKKKWL